MSQAVAPAKESASVEFQIDDNDKWRTSTSKILCVRSEKRYGIYCTDEAAEYINKKLQNAVKYDVVCANPSYFFCKGTAREVANDVENGIRSSWHGDWKNSSKFMRYLPVQYIFKAYCALKNSGVDDPWCASLIPKGQGESAMIHTNFQLQVILVTLVLKYILPGCVPDTNEAKVWAAFPYEFFRDFIDLVGICEKNEGYPMIPCGKRIKQLAVWMQGPHDVYVGLWQCLEGSGLGFDRSPCILHFCFQDPYINILKCMTIKDGEEWVFDNFLLRDKQFRRCSDTFLRKLALHKMQFFQENTPPVIDLDKNGSLTDEGRAWCLQQINDIGLRHKHLDEQLICWNEEACSFNAGDPFSAMSPPSNVMRTPYSLFALVEGEGEKLILREVIPAAKTSPAKRIKQ